MPTEKRRTRSSAYQWMLVEKSFSSEMMSGFPEEDGMHKKLNPFSYNEEVLELEDKLKERLWEIIRENLTKRQLQIVDLLKGGATQSEAARALSVNQSSITKSLNGNVDYSKSTKGKAKASYGGIVKKLDRIVQKDPAVQEIMKRIGELRDEDWF